jgi:hypothetical protein
MTRVYSKALDQSINVGRVIGRVDGAKPGPCLFFFGGIHGNEAAGVFALHQVIEQLKNKKEDLSGSLIAISGNQWALEKSMRYQEVDLNRIWTHDRIKAIESGHFIPENEDEKQQLEIFSLLHDLINAESGPLYFFDLHTTSSTSIPFITVNDSLLNRKFTIQYPVPLILGIEEYLDGPLLSYINELGYVSFGFEGGGHDDPASIKNHKTFIYLSLYFTGALDKSSIEHDAFSRDRKIPLSDQRAFYEIYYRFEVEENARFVMKPGFTNFQPIDKKEHLATIDGDRIQAKKRSIIFMPLYQAKGNDGYYLIRKIPRFFLWLSGLLRKYAIDRFFVFLPGISWFSPLRDTMAVDLRIARLAPRQMLHLFGYRSKQIDKNHLLINNREYRSRKKEYRNEKWYHQSTPKRN